jgi:hypothetical protein
LGCWDGIFDVCEGILYYKVILVRQTFGANSQAIAMIGDEVVREISMMRSVGDFQDTVERAKEKGVIFIPPRNDR